MFIALSDRELPSAHGETLFVVNSLATTPQDLASIELLIPLSSMRMVVMIELQA
jgi:hypothetical protein